MRSWKHYTSATVGWFRQKRNGLVKILLLAAWLVAAALPVLAESGYIPSVVENQTDDCRAILIICPQKVEVAAVVSPAENFIEVFSEAVAIRTTTVPVSKTYTYDIQTRGTITVDMEEFATQVAETYADSRGWSRAGISFRRVTTNSNFTVVLSEASEVPSFSSVCSTQWSCRAGRYVVINQDRWLGASSAWTGSVRDYRHMVINHETGHWLGHGHRNCPAKGQKAPIMQQQSISLQGCVFNSWPLDFEIASS